jgi:hypothetical protein
LQFGCGVECALLLYEDFLKKGKTRMRGKTTMTWKSKLILGIATAVAMFFLSLALPRGGSLQEAQAAQFPMTVGVWAIFVLLFVKLK